MALQGGAPITIAGKPVPVWNPGQPAPPGYTVSADGQSLIDSTGQTVVSRPAVNGTAENAQNPDSNTIVDKIFNRTPVGGTYNAIGDAANGRFGKAAGDFTLGATYGTIPVGGNSIPTAETALGKLPGAAGDAGSAAAAAAGGILGNIVPSTSGLDKASADAQALEQQYLAKLNALQPGAPPQLDPTQQAQFRDAQLGLVGNLQDTIAGNTPSVAQIQQQQAFDQLRAQQSGQAAAAGRGGNLALAQRTAANNIGNLGAQQASASALLRAQEQATARGQLGDVTNAGRSTDVNIAGANQTSAINTRNQDITQQNNLGNQTLQANANDVNAQAAKIAAKNQQLQQWGNIASTGLGVISTLSDERAKTDIRPESSDEIRNFLAQIHPSAYRYKGFAEPKVGVMAQDVERSDVGRTLVRETPAGKAIDIPSATGAMLAALADMHRRVAQLEGGARR